MKIYTMNSEKTYKTKNLQNAKTYRMGKRTEWKNVQNGKTYRNEKYIQWKGLYNRPARKIFQKNILNDQISRPVSLISPPSNRYYQN